MKPDGPTEREFFDLMHQYKCDLGKRKFMDDVHNLRSKAQGKFFVDILQSVIANLRPNSYVLLLNGCSSFKAFTELLSILHEDKRDAIVRACTVFCNQYKLVPMFWEQSSAVDGLNTDRNLVSHRSVADSAAAIMEAAAIPDEFPEAEVSWAMLGALANYSRKNADALETAALEERRKLAMITEQYRKQLK